MVRNDERRGGRSVWEGCLKLCSRPVIATAVTCQTDAPEGHDAPHRSRHQVLGRQGLSRRRRHGPHPLLGTVGDPSTDQKAVNRPHAKIRALVEQAVATLKSWRLLRKLRCSTSRITALVQAALPLHLDSSDR